MISFRLRFAALGVVLFVGFSAGALRADDQQQPPEDIPNFNNLDEFIYIPKTTLNFGARMLLAGPRTTFSGQGSLPVPITENAQSYPGDPNIQRIYHDGSVLPDSRSTTVDAGNGATVTVPIPPDGKTINWSYDNANQYTSDGNMAFHTYSAAITDTSAFTQRGASNSDVELSASRDMGRLGRHLLWNITAGFALSDLRSVTWANVAANVTTTTDTYDLYGQIPPSAPYTSSSTATVSQTVTGAYGTVPATTSTNGVTNSQSGPTQNVSSSTLLGDYPLSRTVNTVLSNDAIQNRYSLEGAYFTFRVGPTFIMPIGTRLSLSLSVGGAMIYSGSEYDVQEYIAPPSGDPFDQEYTSDSSRLVPAYYADLTLQYNLTDTAGFYLGALYEGGGNYTQSVISDDTGATKYTTRVDFNDQQGVRAGMTVKF